MRLLQIWRYNILAALILVYYTSMLNDVIIEELVKCIMLT